MPETEPPGGASAIRDLRMPALGLAAWAGGLAGILLDATWCAGLVVASALLARSLRTRLPARTTVAWLVVAVAVASGALLRQETLERSPVTALAQQGAVVTATMTVTLDPRLREGQFSDFVIVRGRLTHVEGRGHSYRLGVPVLLLADEEWHGVRLGSTVELVARLSEADGPGLAAILSARSAPRVTAEPSATWRATTRVRASLRRAVEHLEPAPRTLVPALVVGDDEGMPVDLADDFRTTGLTHLLAVSGTNLTLVVGFALIVARWLGVRGRWLYVVGAVGIVGFVLLARTEPSVVRAAAMGSVALIAMGSNGRERGARAIGVAVVALLLIDPWLATTVGFALSVLATSGILFLAPIWRDAMMRWLPRWLSEAIAVPAAAQLACTPVIAGISGQVSLVAVAANLVAGPAVAPATVIGLLAGFVGLVSPSLATLLGSGAGWSVSWIIGVARRGAAMPTGAVEWSTGPTALAILVALCVVIALATPVLLGRARTGVACGAVMVLVVTVPLPSPGWPPPGWVVAACDVGQGDGIVLNVGAGAGVVMDVGVAPDAIDDCLRRLDITEVPLLALSHFHADHVGGLAGVLDGRRVGEILVTGLAEPAAGAELVTGLAAEAGVVARVPAYGEAWRFGELTLQVIAPRVEPGGSILAHAAGRGSAANNASLVLLAEVGGIRVLLTGDIEPEAQGDLARSLPSLTADVLKVPHHGSRHQDVDFLVGLDARLALVSVGEGNTYGHPSPDVLSALEESGVRVHRTDLAGDVLVVLEQGELHTRARG
ncbi:DNA internalization-related competence protein ComEC/Rec2 [Nocardioides sp.]|uniref:DNA internalization-related competence protein ComEC/Rec2 n=1 Tax=Nocardioides sp. TaxID=35761 RepID=UPI002734422C|nr:DNA internalization-related competence protein ComEC/Rec2 [Nocardioides sp.]MDP3892335.1 DNA internalization-related competence protein ComEC/Rec2 [Nocardioides sp.]